MGVNKLKKLIIGFLFCFLIINFVLANENDGSNLRTSGTKLVLDGISDDIEVIKIYTDDIRHSQTTINANLDSIELKLEDLKAGNVTNNLVLDNIMEGIRTGNSQTDQIENQLEDLKAGQVTDNLVLDNIMEGIRTGNAQTDLLESQGASNNIYLGQIETAVEIMDDWDSGDKCKVTLPDNTNSAPLFVQLATMNRMVGNYVITGNSTAKTITFNVTGYIGPIRNYHLTSRLFVSRQTTADVNGIDGQYIINPNSYLDMSIFGLMNEPSHCTVSVLFEDEATVGTANVTILRLIR